MDPTAEAWRLTLELLERCDPDQELRVQAIAHLGAAVMLFEQCDPDTGAALLGVIENTNQREAQREASWISPT